MSVVEIVGLVLAAFGVVYVLLNLASVASGAARGGLAWEFYIEISFFTAITVVGIVLMAS